MSGRTVVVIEDEATIAASLAARLESEGFEVATAADGTAGVDLCRRLRPDVVVLDLMLPGLDGLEVCRRIQAEREVPVLMLTARDSENDLLVGLGVGADDYMTKPFSPRELVARLHALLRRAERSSSADRELVHAGSLKLDLAARRAFVDGDEVHLTPIEFDLVRRLATRPGVVYTREQLMAQVWGYEEALGARTVDSHVGALRRKLGAGLVRTVHGVGYSLEAGRR